MEKTVFTFLNEHYNPEKPVLLGLSGGPDSLSLFHLLLKYKESKKLAFGIAHVDHAWRAESGQEALQLEHLAAVHGLQFHLKKLNPKEMKGNLEAACREARLQFFEEICHRCGYQAVILGHHAGDQVETVLKRVLEGSSLPYLCGLQEITTLEKLIIWRPLLRFRKEIILDWIKKQGLIPFEDRTNLDPKYLRGRFRTRLLPLLSQEFGKEVYGSLERLGSEAAELKDYLDLKLKGFLAKIENGKRGIYLDLSREGQLHLLEIKYLIRKFAERADVSLSRTCIDTAAELILTQAADRQIVMASQNIYIDRGRLFLMPVQGKFPLGTCSLKPGTYHYGSWTVSVSIENIQNFVTDWKSAWEGRCEVWLPEGNYQLGPALLHAGFPRGTPISKWWTNAKVPAFLRHLVPVVWEGNQIKAEFLSGRYPKRIEESMQGLKISLVLKDS